MVDPGGLPVGSVVTDAEGVSWSVGWVDFKRFDEIFGTVYAAKIPGPFDVYYRPW